MWVDLIEAGTGKKKLDWKSNKITEAMVTTEARAVILAAGEGEGQRMGAGDKATVLVVHLQGIL